MFKKLRIKHRAWFVLRIQKGNLRAFIDYKYIAWKLYTELQNTIRYIGTHGCMCDVPPCIVFHLRYSHIHIQLAGSIVGRRSDTVAKKKYDQISGALIVAWHCLSSDHYGVNFMHGVFGCSTPRAIIRCFNGYYLQLLIFMLLFALTLVIIASYS